MIGHVVVCVEDVFFCAKVFFCVQMIYSVLVTDKLAMPLSILQLCRPNGFAVQIVST